MSADPTIEFTGAAKEALEGGDTEMGKFVMPPERKPVIFELDKLCTLIGALNEACGTPEQAHRLLSVLVPLDSISGKGEDRATLERLRAAGVLESAGRNMLRIATDFQPVTALLRSRLPEASR